MIGRYLMEIFAKQYANKRQDIFVVALFSKMMCDESKFGIVIFVDNFKFLEWYICVYIL